MIGTYIKWRLLKGEKYMSYIGIIKDTILVNEDNVSTTKYLVSVKVAGKKYIDPAKCRVEIVDPYDIVDFMEKLNYTTKQRRK